MQSELTPGLPKWSGSAEHGYVGKLQRTLIGDSSTAYLACFNFGGTTSTAKVDVAKG